MTANKGTSIIAVCGEDMRVTEQGQWEQRDVGEFQSYVGGRVDGIP